MIIIFILILIIFLFYLVYKKFENFEDVNINNDFYLPSDITINNLTNKKINASNICIFERSDNKKKITDIECISADELISTLNLPKERMKMLCVDNNCIDAEDLKILTGDREFKLVSLSDNDSFKDKCLGDNREVKLRRCGHNIPDDNNEKINSLAPYSCSDGNSINFKLVLGNNSDKNLTRGKLTNIATLPVNEPIEFAEGHIIS